MVPVRVHTIVISVSHSPDVTLEKIRKELREKVINSVIPAEFLDERTIYHLNPAGRFLSAGPMVCISAFLLAFCNCFCPIKDNTFVQ